MRALLFFSTLFLGAAALQAGNAPTTGLAALHLLPAKDAANVARIEARGANLEVERWHILVHNPAEESGVREYVVADGQVVAARALSQFVEALSEDDVIPADALKIDSDRAAAVAREYAGANRYEVGSLNFEMCKIGDDGTPVWTVTCVDKGGKRVGEVVVGTEDGDVVSHSGFPSEPKAGAEKGDPAKKEAAEQERRERSKSREREKAKRALAAAERKPAPIPVRAAVPVENPHPAPSVNPLQRLFGGNRNGR